MNSLKSERLQVIKANDGNTENGRHLGTIDRKTVFPLSNEYNRSIHQKVRGMLLELSVFPIMNFPQLIQ